MLLIKERKTERKLFPLIYQIYRFYLSKKKKKSVDLIKRGMKISNKFHAEGSVQKEKTLIALERLL